MPVFFTYFIEMKRINSLCLLFCSLLLLPLVSRAQLSEAENLRKQLATTNRDTVAWLHGGEVSIGLNEGFLHNWAAGGELASISLAGLFSGHVTRMYHNHVWTNNLEAAYSLLYAYSNNFVPRKTDDRLDFTSRYGVRFDSTNYFLTALLNFKSQFTRGYDYNLARWDTLTTSRFMSPAYLTLALGTEFRKGSDRSMFLSPVAARTIFASRQFTTRSPEGAFGIPYGKTQQFQLGAYFSGRYNVSLSPTVSYRTRLDLYANYLARDKHDSLGRVISRDNPGNIDLMSEHMLTLHVSRLFKVALGLTLIYDNDIPYQSSVSDGAGGNTVRDEPGQSLGWWQVKQLFTFNARYRF